MAAEGEITRVLAELRGGDRTALDRLFPLVYRELRDSAHRQLARGRPGDTLSTTALVHETYLKLVGSAKPDWADRRHFFAVAARAMRQIIVDYARRVTADKRGGGTTALALDVALLPAAERASDLIALDDALSELGALSERLAQVVELRFFAGLSVEETGEALELSPRTVKRDWEKARAYLFRAVQGG
jgi:RNA polymerase sigma factor (TIGR02999 family)